MAEKRLMVDSTILIDYFRKTDKNNSRLVNHFQTFDTLFISSVTEFEVINGATHAHLQFWNQMLTRVHGLTLDTINRKDFVHIDSLDLLAE
jgi:predicted nucleic acid-binding protein